MTTPRPQREALHCTVIHVGY